MSRGVLFDEPYGVLTPFADAQGRQTLEDCIPMPRRVHRMTAAVGLPTLRLVRVGVGPWQPGGLQPGEWTERAEWHGLEKPTPRR